MEYINDRNLRHSRIILEMSLKTFISSIFLFIGVTQRELASLIIGILLTTPCVYGFVKFLFISRRISYNKTHILIDNREIIGYETVSRINRVELNFILKFMWSIAKNRFTLIPPDELIEIHYNKKGFKKKTLFFINLNDPNSFMTFISHVKAYHPGINIDI